MGRLDNPRGQAQQLLWEISSDQYQEKYRQRVCGIDKIHTRQPGQNNRAHRHKGRPHDSLMFGFQGQNPYEMTNGSDLVDVP